MTQTLLVGPAGSSILLTLRASSLKRALRDVEVQMQPLTTQAEMAHTCRGTINLSTAHIDTEDSCNIVLSNGGRTYHLKANSEVERQRWVTALELAKAKAIRMRNNQSDDSGDEEPASQSDKSELHGTLKTLSSKLEDLSTCNELIAKHGAALQRSLSELENLNGDVTPSVSTSRPVPPCVPERWVGGRAVPAPALPCAA
nr:oxysterol-binding protein 1-like [Columba livia]